VLLDACKKYPMPGRRLLTFEYILIDGFNSSTRDRGKIAALLKISAVKLNLIVFNEFPGSPFKSPPQKDVAAFQQTLINIITLPCFEKVKAVTFSPPADN